MKGEYSFEEFILALSAEMGLELLPYQKQFVKKIDGMTAEERLAIELPRRRRRVNTSIPEKG